MQAKYLDFYFSEKDPDYEIKGSRDPLGLQVIWQSTAKSLIPYLSTVSNNILDFQILSLGYYLYEKDDPGLVSFFLKFEQYMGYVRYKYNPKDGFGGVDKVRKRMTQGLKTFSISTSKEDQLLSNQRAYGIWAKYSRPFLEMGIPIDSQFVSIYNEKVSRLNEKEKFLKFIKRMRDSEQIKISIDDLALGEQLLELTEDERQFYTEKILKDPRPGSFQNDLFNFIKKEHFIQDLSIYSFLDEFSNASKSNIELIRCLNEIKKTEKVISPLNRIFRYLQTRSVWPKAVLDNDDFISICKNDPNREVDCIFSDTVKRELSETLNLRNWDLVGAILRRNKVVVNRRGGAPWLSISKDLVEIHSTEGSLYDPNYNPSLHNDFSYFISCYLGLYRQIIINGN